MTIVIPISFIRSLFVLSFLLILTACSTDIETNAPEQDIPVIYSFINPDSTNQYIRITKTFQNRNNVDAREIAANQPAFYNYPLDELEVFLYSFDRFGNKQTLSRFIPETNSWKSPDGIFNFPNQILYRNESPFTFDPIRHFVYQLEVRNLKSGKVVTAATPLISNFTFSAPSELDSTSANNALIFTVEENATGNFITINGVPSNATFYRANLIIRYREFYEDGTSKDTSILWNNVIPTLANITNPANINGDFQAEGFFTTLVNSIPEKSNVKERHFLSCPFLFYAGTQEFETYLDILNNFNPISQIRPIYTNIQGGGLGVFTNVRTKRIIMRVSPSTVRDMSLPTTVYPRLPLLKFTR